MYYVINSKLHNKNLSTNFAGQSDRGMIKRENVSEIQNYLKRPNYLTGNLFG